MMDDEKLIEQIKRFQHLYDLSHPKYMDSIKKNIAWKDISKQLRQPVAACKQRWQSLRDAYRRVLNKRKTKSSSAKASIKKWKYEREMAFLIPFFVERRYLKSVDVSRDREESDDLKEVNIVSKQSLHDQGNINSVTSDTDNVVAVGNTAAPSIDNGFRNVNKEHKNKKQLYCKNIPREPSASVLMAHMLEERAKERAPDEMDSFFLNISSTIKKFTPYLQALAKNKIFTLVSEIEIQQFTPPELNSPTTSTWAKPDSRSKMPPSPIILHVYFF